MGSRRAMETDVCTLYDAKKGNVQPTTVITYKYTGSLYRKLSDEFFLFKLSILLPCVIFPLTLLFVYYTYKIRYTHICN